MCRTVITILAGLHVFSKFVNQSSQSSQVWIQFALVKSVRPVTPTLCPSWALSLEVSSAQTVSNIIYGPQTIYK